VGLAAGLVAALVAGVVAGLASPDGGVAVVALVVQASRTGRQAKPAAPAASCRNRRRSMSILPVLAQVVTASNEKTPAACVPGASTRVSLGVSDTAPVRLTDFWQRMGDQFGPTYAESFARDFVLSELGGRTIREAIEQGDEVVAVWRAVCRTVEVDPQLR
jgi:hypothetical protein